MDSKSLKDSFEFILFILSIHVHWNSIMLATAVLLVRNRRLCTSHHRCLSCKMASFHRWQVSNVLTRVQQRLRTAYLYSAAWPSDELNMDEQDVQDLRSESNLQFGYITEAVIGCAFKEITSWLRIYPVHLVHPCSFESHNVSHGRFTCSQPQALY